MAENRCKYYKQKKQVSYDNGVTWQDVIPYQYQKGALYEQQSQDCGYIPPVTQYRWVKTEDTTCIGSPDPPVTTYKIETWVNDEYLGHTSCDDERLKRVDITRATGSRFRYMTKAVIGNCVKYIGNSQNLSVRPADYVFSGCTKLTSVTIPYGVKYIGWYAFSKCKKLADITLPNSLTHIYTSAFTSCDSITSITIPDSVTSIGAYAFKGCESLTSIKIPSSVEDIKYGTFEGCESLTSCIIENGITSIGAYAFNGCKSLTSITIPDSVTSIGDAAFQSCTGLTSIICLATTPPTLIYGTIPYCPIYVPAESVEVYKSASGWRDYSSYIQPIP